MDYFKEINNKIKQKFPTAAGMRLQSTFLVVMLGAPCVGKRSLMYRLHTGKFDSASENNTKIVKQMELILDNSEHITLEVADNASVKPLSSAINLLMSIINGNAFVLVFSLDDKSSFEATCKISDTIIEIKGYKSVPIVVVANKADIDEDKRQVCPIFADLVFTFDHGHRFVLASAKDGRNVEKILKELTHKT